MRLDVRSVIVGMLAVAVVALACGFSHSRRALAVERAKTRERLRVVVANADELRRLFDPATVETLFAGLSQPQRQYLKGQQKVLRQLTREYLAELAE